MQFPLSPFSTLWKDYIYRHNCHSTMNVPSSSHGSYLSPPQANSAIAVRFPEVRNRKGTEEDGPPTSGTLPGANTSIHISSEQFLLISILYIWDLGEKEISALPRNHYQRKEEEIFNAVYPFIHTNIRPIYHQSDCSEICLDEAKLNFIFAFWIFIAFQHTTPWQRHGKDNMPQVVSHTSAFSQDSSTTSTSLVLPILNSLPHSRY